MLEAEWTAESLVAYEEEVMNFGLFDAVFDHTFFSRDHPFLEDAIHKVWDQLTPNDFVGTRPALTIPGRMR